ncbi:acetolactate synthase [Sarracenia purpurea var. burkii]
MGILEASILHHICIVLLLLWLLSYFNCCHPAAYFISLIYLYLIHERYVMRLRKTLRFEERRRSNQRRVLADSESVRWLNYVVEKMWPVCMEQIFSQKILLPIIPWFLQKYKPWTVKEAVVQSLYMGRSPPLFTEMRVLRQSTGDDHLVLELGMNFRTADDMGAILAVKLTKRLGFGMRAKLHLMGMHVEGKVLIGVKFLRHWPFLGRMRICFVEPPYFQMTVKPLSTHGVDVTELPGIAGWLDKLLDVAFEQTLVEPNMLVVDMEKFVSPQPESWFSVDEKEPIAYALLEVIEAADMKPSDLNGLADPYVKGRLGPYRFRTKTQWKTLSPKWHEEFKVPICSWESANVLAIEVRDKDHFVDDTLGECSISIGEFRDGQRHDMWLALQSIKMGRLHLAITVVEANRKAPDQSGDVETLKNKSERNSIADESETAQNGSLSSGVPGSAPKVADKFEPVDIEGQEQTGIWVHQPGSEVSQIWEPRKGRSRTSDAQIPGEGSDRVGSFKSSPSRSSYINDSSSSDETEEGNKGRPNKVMRGIQKIFHRKSRKEDKSGGVEEHVSSPHANVKAVNAKEIGVKLIMEEDNLALTSVKGPKEGTESPERRGPESPSKGHVKDIASPESPSKRHVKDMAKSIFKHAGKSAREIKHTFSRKGSKNSRRDSGLEGSVGSESSDEESVPSSVDTSGIDGIPVISKPISRSGGDSFKSEELNDREAPSDHAMNIEDPVKKIHLEGPRNIGDDPSIGSEEKGDVLVKDSSNPKHSEENLEADIK